MKQFLVLTIAIFMSGCSMENMVQKTVPADVVADHAAHIDHLLELDGARIIAAFDVDIDNAEAQARLDEILKNVPDGSEIRRDYVSMNSASKVSTGEGRSRDIELVTEVQTTDGFMLVASQYALDADGNCCQLTNLNVSAHETSPIRAGLETLLRVLKIFGLVLLVFILGLTIFLIRRGRRKKAEAAP